MDATNKEIIITKPEQCVGCNKCIAECPVKAKDMNMLMGIYKNMPDELKVILHCRCLLIY